MSEVEEQSVVEAAKSLGSKRTLGWVWPVLLVLLFAAGSLAVSVVEEVAEGDTAEIDRALLLAFRQPGDLALTVGPPWLRQAAIDISALGGFTLLWLFGLAGVVYLALRSRRAEAAWLVASLLGAEVVSSSLKNLFHRDRPTVVPHLAEVSTASFPSGHATAAAAVYLTLGLMLAQADPRPLRRAYLLGFMSLIVLLIGWSRVFLGVHWPSDVVAGWCVGAIWALGIFAANRLLKARRSWPR